jgi:signal transduction histidine kinase
VRRRLILSNLVLVMIVLLLLEIPLAIVYGRHEHDALDTALQRDAGSLAALSEEIIEHPGDHDVGTLAQRFSASADDIVMILDRTGTPLTPHDALGSDPTLLAAATDARSGQTVAGEVHGLTYVAVPVGAVGDSHGAVLIARPDAAIDHRIHQFWLLLAAIGGGVLLLSVLISRRLARWAVDPLARLDTQAEELGRGDLHVRADSAVGPPEVVALARTFNEMATRLDDLVTSQRRFVADASHQLRTPLTALRLRLENLDANDPAALATTRDAALLETARLTRLVDGLLALARAERLRPNQTEIDVSAIVAQRHEAWAPLAAERDIALELRPDGRDHIGAKLVPGHLDQILDNLIDNAIDATPPGRTVELQVRAVGPKVEIHVTDEGRGMTDEERQRAFDPFWQSPHGHSSGSTGLGLAIVDQLARASNATVVLVPSATGGIDATIVLPSTDVLQETDR